MALEEIKKLASLTSEAPRNIIKQCKKHLSDAARLEVDIPPELRKTFNDENFVLEDTGAGDPDRIIIFSSEKNIDILNESSM